MCTRAAANRQRGGRVLSVEAPDGPKRVVPLSPKGERTRARLIEAAKAVFQENGFLAARISDIAESAGLSHGSFYHYFESKEEIFREVALAVDERLSAPLTDIILDSSVHTPPSERIRRAIRQHLESYRDEARIMGVIAQVSRYDEVLSTTRRERHAAARHQVAQSIRQLQLHGLCDPRLDPRIAAAVLGAMTNRFPEMWMVENLVACSFDEGAEQLTRIFLNGLGIADP